MHQLAVSLCTWNGERYLQEQLESIASQTRPPDSLVIRDDASTDATLRIAERFARSAPFPVEVRANQVNLGFVRNFERAIADAEGDVIVLSDQDDIWREDRLERIAGCFEARPELGLCFSDARLIDEAGSGLPASLWESVGFTRARQREVERGRLFEELVRGSFVTGATLSFSARFRAPVLPLVDGVTHDAWITLLLAAIAPAEIIPEPLVSYRQHGGNQIGARRLGTLARLQRARTMRLDGLRARRAHHLAALERLAPLGAPAPRLELLRESVRHLDARIALPIRRGARIPPISRELSSGSYARISGGIASAARDLLA
jgi:glycosyltransferase involved in cell wall biosynthesis